MCAIGKLTEIKKVYIHIVRKHTYRWRYLQHNGAVCMYICIE